MPTYVARAFNCMQGESAYVRSDAISQLVQNIPVAKETITERIEMVVTWSQKSLSAFCEAAGLSRNTISTMKSRGSKAQAPETLAKIARAGGVRLDWLITGEGHPF